MPLEIPPGAPTLFIRRAAYERSGIARSSLDEKLGLTDQEFRVEGELVVIGPVHDAEAFTVVLDQLEELGLAYYEDYFELSGNWPSWVAVLAASSEGPGRSKPSQPQR